MATYKHLAEHHSPQTVKQLLRRYKDRPLFLNVDDPACDDWCFHPASAIMFNVPDDGDYHEARALLVPFRKLLVDAGAFEFRRVTAQVRAPAAADKELAVLRAAFDGLRARHVLTTVVFRAPADALWADGVEHWAHRALLAAASEYFNDLFSSGFAEGGAASVDNPIVIAMQTPSELHCAGLILGALLDCLSDEAHSPRAPSQTMCTPGTSMNRRTGRVWYPS